MQAIIKVLPWSCQRIPCNGSYSFSDQATFHNSRYRHDCKILRSGRTTGTIEHQHDSPKINIWCGLTHDGILDPFICVKRTILNIDVYCDILELLCLSAVGRCQSRTSISFLYCNNYVCRNLDARFPNRWIGKARSISWPQRSPTIITLLNFIVKEYSTSKPRVLRESMRQNNHP